MSDLEQRIRERAYEIWENEGRPQGRSNEHWAQARAEFADARSETGAPPRNPTVPRARAAKPATAKPTPPPRQKATRAKDEPDAKGDAIAAKELAKSVNRNTTPATAKATVKKGAATPGRKPK